MFRYFQTHLKGILQDCAFCSGLFSAKFHQASLPNGTVITVNRGSGNSNTIAYSMHSHFHYYLIWSLFQPCEGAGQVWLFPSERRSTRHGRFKHCPWQKGIREPWKLGPLVWSCHHHSIATSSSFLGNELLSVAKRTWKKWVDLALSKVSWGQAKWEGEGLQQNGLQTSKFMNRTIRSGRVLRRNLWNLSPNSSKIHGDAYI